MSEVLELPVPDRTNIPTNADPEISIGSPFPQGATFDGKGTNFALFSEGAESVDLCLFDDGHDLAESSRISVTERTNGIWHVYLPGVGPGQLYGYRVHGSYDPAKGLRFNPHKILLDPYAKAIGRDLKWDDAVFGYQIGNEAADLSFDERDSAPFAPLGIVVGGEYDWEGDRPPATRWHDTVIYEAHVRGLTMRHPDVPEHLRGTYAAIGSEPVIDHLKKLGITAIELMPVHSFLHDRHLLDRGLRNYWGYNTLNFFAPHRGYAACRGTPAEVVREFRGMVKSLHRAGIEVILDVVYNHTAEGNEMGPTLSFRGIDNLAYYRTVADNARYYMDYTGCGNTLNMVHPHSLQLLMDSLRYWVTEMHIDGFRFDLAAALARELHEVDQLGAFFDTIYQDPTLASIKLIAEPWDLGDGGYQVGNFPVGWTEWNGKYRDAVRKYWKGDMGMHGEIATRLGGSSDLYEHNGRQPSAGVNFITAHDGFTLHDLVSYNAKHNEANGEENRDGADDNNSWNCGAEGETDDDDVQELRRTQIRNFLATLMLSQGVPMLCAGDEMGRTQGGNNNAYCQDSELSWVDWDLDDWRRSLLNFSRKLIHFRRAHPNFHRHSFYEKTEAVQPDSESVRWVRADGEAMREEDWEEGGWMRTLGMLLFGDAPQIRNAEGRRVRDNDYLLLLNAHHEPVRFRLPADVRRKRWNVMIDTAHPDQEEGSIRVRTGYVDMAARSLVVVCHSKSSSPRPPAPAPQSPEAQDQTLHE